MNRILIVEDKDSLRRMLETVFSQEGYECVLAETGEKGIERIQRGGFDVIVTDLKLPKKSGMEVLRVALDEDPLVTVIVMTAFGSIETAVEAMRLGAYDFLTKPFDPDHMLMLVQRGLERKSLIRESIILRKELSDKIGAPKIIGRSRSFEIAVEQMKKVAQSNATTMLLGESGTGKELFARAIHFLGPRAGDPFVALNCAAIPEHLLESELFGHEKGAFTDAICTRLGKFELAHQGTLFLDEIGDMPLKLQAKLLRVLQEQTFERVGGVKQISVDIRVITASNKDIHKLITEGAFREDLFYRVSVFPIKIPPLRERTEDIILLAEYFLARFTQQTRRKELVLTPEAKRELVRYAWPGNIRELENCMERAMILAEGIEIGPEYLNLWNPKEDDGFPLSNINLDNPLAEVVSKVSGYVEDRMIRLALEQTEGNKTKAAKILDVSYKTLLNKIKEFQI